MHQHDFANVIVQEIDFYKSHKVRRPHHHPGGKPSSFSKHCQPHFFESRLQEQQVIVIATPIQELTRSQDSTSTSDQLSQHNSSSPAVHRVHAYYLFTLPSSYITIITYYLSIISYYRRSFTDHILQARHALYIPIIACYRHLILAPLYYYLFDYFILAPSLFHRILLSSIWFTAYS